MCTNILGAVGIIGEAFVGGFSGSWDDKILQYVNKKDAKVGPHLVLANHTSEVSVKQDSGRSTAHWFMHIQKTSLNRPTKGPALSGPYPR